MATQSNKLRAMDASVRIFVDCRGQPTRQYTVKNHAAHMPKWVCVCVCVCATKHRCQLPAADPSGLLLGELSCPEQTLELDLGGKDTAEERTGVERGRGSDQKQLHFSFFFFLFYQPGRGILLWIRERYKERKHGGRKRSLDIQPLRVPWQPSHFSLLNSSSNTKAADGQHRNSISRQAGRYFFSVRVKLRHPRHSRHEGILSADPRLNSTVGKVHK